jgi:hypothetical protein
MLSAEVLPITRRITALPLPMTSGMNRAGIRSPTAGLRAVAEHEAGTPALTRRPLDPAEFPRQIGNRKTP